MESLADATGVGDGFPVVAAASMALAIVLGILSLILGFTRHKSVGLMLGVLGLGAFIPWLAPIVRVMWFNADFAWLGRLLVDSPFLGAGLVGPVLLNGTGILSSLFGLMRSKGVKRGSGLAWSFGIMLPVAVVVCIGVFYGVGYEGRDEFGTAAEYLMACSMKPERHVSSEPAVFSPDGTMVVFQWWEREVVGFGPEPGFLKQGVFIKWCQASNASEVKTAKVDEVGFGWRHNLVQSYVGFAVSPDSRRVAVVSRGTLSCIDLKDGRHWRLSKEGERVTGMAWLSGEVVGYSTHRTRGRDVWLQNVLEPSNGRESVFREEGAQESDLRESWSPTGKHVLLMDRYDDEDGTQETRLLSVEDGEARTIAGWVPGSDWGVAWKPDGTRVLLVCSSYIGEKMILVEAGTGAVKDLSGEWKGVSSSWPDVEALWTADGKYVIARILDEGAFLIQPEPWSVIELGKKLGRWRGGARGTPKVFSPAWIYWLAVPGLVRSDDGFAVDYEGKKLVDLDRGWRVLSPDGKMTAEVDEAGYVKVEATVLLTGEDGR